MARQRAVIVGGKGFNVPKQLHRYFEVVWHVEQDKSSKINSVPDCDIILVIRDYVHHQAIQQITSLAPGVPVVAARAGWSHLYVELERRHLLPFPEDVYAMEVAPTEQTDDPVTGPPIPMEEQISDEELERLTAPPVAEASAEPKTGPQEVEGIMAGQAAPILQLVPGTPKVPEEDDRIATLADLFKATAGELTPEIRELYRQKYNERLPGPIAAAARRLAGLEEPRRSTSPVARVSENPAIREALILYANIERILDSRNEKLAEIETLNKEIRDLDKELEIYKPVIQHFEGLKRAQQAVKLALEQKAIQDRKAQ